jgi:hypothetical protein
MSGFEDLQAVIYQTETSDFGGYSFRDAAAVTQRVWEAGYRQVMEPAE